jgi:hypothetical protein
VRDPNHNSVDFSQRTAAPEQGGDDERMMRALQQALPHYWVWGDPVQSKKFVDGLRDAMSGTDTTAIEDARLRQAEPEEEGHLNRKFDDEFWSGNNPEQWRRSHFGKL